MAEAARRVLMGIYGRLTEKDGVRGRSTILSGKDAQNQPLIGHRHAHYLPTDEDGDGRLDHLTIFATSGLDRTKGAPWTGCTNSGRIVRARRITHCVCF